MSSTHQHRTIKSEPTNPQIWELPPSVPLPKLPLEDPNRKMTINQYLSISKNPQKVEQKWPTIDIPMKEKEVLKLVILDCISRAPEIIENKNTKTVHLDYAKVAIQVFRRTGYILSPQVLMFVFRAAKEQLRVHLRAAISTKLVSPAEVEKRMWEWPVYGFIRFYRCKLQKWEAQLRQKYIKPAGGDQVVFDIDDNQLEDDQEMFFAVEEESYEEEDIVWETTQSESPPAILSSTVNIKLDHHEQFQEQPTSSSHDQWIPSMDNTFEHQPEGIIPIDQMNQLDQTDDHENTEMKIVGYTSNLTDEQLEDIREFQISMEHISHQANRVARRQPEKINRMRQALFLAVFELEKSDVTDMGEFFAGMAELYRSK
ncbi:hypothetical protein GCK72_006756 [Caenorhabditis remanei]|uniref:Uncharacterized protein n=1 Tax=Caenorhabditis remanei TaxID=31234 RepID=A0A6A5HG48_CAERE|nr:hypothetical protein GCK72_006756 [Caenorhabditis remanei]KAF1766798.1 hypothetical protein GCK72_006756 [Caenorhabditis remanei]